MVVLHANDAVGDAMKGIAATATSGEINFFWLDSGFAMHGYFAPGLPILGGYFTSPPVAVSSLVRRSVISTTGNAGALMDAPAARADIATPAPAPQAATAALAAGATIVSRGGASTVLSTGASQSSAPGLSVVGVIGGEFITVKQFDLFGLGTDYAMYHKRYEGDVTANDPSGWTSLGGIFTSAPAAIAWGNGRVDVFGLGTDHAMFQKTANGGEWSANWVRLGGTFTSAASLVVSGSSLNLFARGNDFTLRGSQTTDGSTWSDFENHGGNLASPPAAVSWGANRIDVFAVFNDGSLNHIWWDGQIWNEWENLGGAYMGEPAAVSWAVGRLDVFVKGSDGQLHHHWFDNNTWAVPEVLNVLGGAQVADSPTAISTGANEINVFVPTTTNEIIETIWNGESWGGGTGVSGVRLPWRYGFSVDYVTASKTRAFLTDTDAAVGAVTPGNAAIQTAVQWIGDIGGPDPSQAQTNLIDVVPVTIDLAEPMSFNYQVVNNGHAAQSAILTALASGGTSLGLAGTASMEETIGEGIAKIVTVTIQSATKINIPVVGSIVSAIEGWLLSQLTSIVFANCDGIVAVEMRAMMGSDLLKLVGNGAQKFTTTTTHQGTDSATGCGSNSVYEVTWSIAPA